MKNSLKMGDLLIYSNLKTPLGFLIGLKTWHSITHVEVYVGDFMTIGARFKGVDYYPYSTENLVQILRPRVQIDIYKGLIWFEKECKGQKYDWKGLLGFLKIVKGGDREKQFCSELVTRFYRKCGLEPFIKKEDADKIAPFQLAISPVFEQVWYKE